MNRPHFIFIGPPGSGKGTQSKLLARAFGYRHISTGDLFREEVDRGGPLGERVKSIMGAGHLVDDKTALELLKLRCPPNAGPYIFDGFPRNRPQAQALDQEVLGPKAKRAPVHFCIDQAELLDRAIHRRVAKGSGEIYNLKTRPPARQGRCDVSGEPLIHREDDRPEVVMARLEVFRKSAGPLLDYYRDRGELVEVDASGGPDELFEQLQKVANAPPSKGPNLA